MANDKKDNVITEVRKKTPKTITELERQPLHLALFALAGIIAILFCWMSFFTYSILLGLLGYAKIGIACGIVSVFADLIFGFLLLYCFMIGKRRPSLSNGAALIISLLIIALGGFAGIFAGIMGICGAVIGFLRGSKLVPEYQIIDEMFLMYKDGRLIRHYTRRLKPSVDEDILSSMLVAVQDFVKDSFERSTGEDSSLDEMKFGEFKIIIGRGKYVIIAALCLGTGINKLKEQITKAIADIEKKYEPVLKNWNGVMDDMRPLNKEMKDLIDGEYDGVIHYKNA